LTGSESAKVNLDNISVSLDVPSKFQLAKLRVKDRESMKALDDYVEANNSKKPYRRANCRFAAFPIE
jgi:hypothetical protein